MKRFKNILVIPRHPAADDPALVRVATLAAINGARVTVLWPLQEDEMEELIVAESDTRELASINEQLSVAVEPLRRQNIPIETRILTGPSLEDIVVRELTIEHDHDLVMKVARPANQDERSLFGPAALHLLRRCPCPVWIVDPQHKEGRGNVLAAVDPALDSDEDPLNIMIMELAVSLAQMQRTELHVVHTWAVAEEQALRHSPFLRIPPTEAVDYVHSIEAQHQQRLDALVAGFLDIVPATHVHLIKGDASDVVPAFARDNNVDVVVMGTHARSGIKRLLMGSTAESIVAAIECSVLAIKPSAAT